ncbi:UDP-N-acetylglucosamine/UDP-N-acetylgalactosamine diphosphorylase [Pancytospora philotis]|nr:UDP-N-acetylglucosamine/UDP-N-acetylgalactosamine diphosphorylase [Pancytospora philotis]
MHPLRDEDVIIPYDSEGLLNASGAELYKKGQEVLSSGKALGVVILSGGEGSRLGLSYPKGMHEMEGRSLFEWHISRLEELHVQYKTRLYLFVMTSDSTNEAVEEYFAGKSYSFLEGVEIFKQDSIEALSMADRSTMKLGCKTIRNPMGNGDFYNAIKKAKNLEHVDALNVISVDNVLAHILDEVYVGAFYTNKLDILSKAILAEENEKVGAFFQDGSRIRIREYSEAQSGDKHLYGNICNHLFSAAFVKLAGEKELPLHEAHKKIPYTDASNRIVSPNEPNGIKREKFLFDAFEFSSRNLVMVVPREDEFAPLKNSLEATSDNVNTCAASIRSKRLKKRILFPAS